MNRTSFGVLVLAGVVGVLGCSDPTGPEVVGEVVWAELPSPGGTFMGDGVIFPDTEPIDFPGIELEREGKTIDVRGAAVIGGCGAPEGVVELEGDRLTVLITVKPPAFGCFDEAFPFAFRATTTDLESGSYDMRVIYDRVSGHEDATVVFTETVEID